MAIQDPQSGAPTSARPAGASPDEQPSTGELLKGLADDTTTLIRQEILLARQELQEGLTASAKASAMLVAAGVLGLIGKNRLAASKVAPEKARAELQTTANELKEEITWGKPQQQPPAR